MAVLFKPECLAAWLAAIAACAAAQARTPYDDMVEAFAAQERTEPKLSDIKDPNDKNFSYYDYRRMHHMATAFVNWMNAPVMAQQKLPLPEHTVQAGAEFRGYVLSHLERANVDWRKKCESAQDMELPNLLVYQVAQAFLAEEPPKDANWGDNAWTSVAVAKAVFTRCMVGK